MLTVLLGGFGTTAAAQDIATDPAADPAAATVPEADPNTAADPAADAGPAPAPAHVTASTQQTGLSVVPAGTTTHLTLDLQAANIVPNSDGVVAIARAGAGNIVDVVSAQSDGKKLLADDLKYLNDKPDNDYILLRLPAGVVPAELVIEVQLDTTGEGVYAAVPDDRVTSIPDYATVFPAQEPPATTTDTSTPPAGQAPTTDQINPDGTTKTLKTRSLASPMAMQAAAAGEVAVPFTTTRCEKGTTFEHSFIYLRVGADARITRIGIVQDSYGGLKYNQTVSPRAWTGSSDAAGTLWTPYNNGQQIVPQLSGTASGYYVPRMDIDVNMTLRSGQFIKLEVPAASAYCGNVKIEMYGASDSPPPDTSLPPGGPDVSWNPGNLCSATGSTVWVNTSQDENASGFREGTDLYAMKFGSNEQVLVGPRTPWIYNALAYNPKDGWLYAISQGQKKVSVSGKSIFVDVANSKYPAGHLLRISPNDHSIQDMGMVKGFQGTPTSAWPNDLYGGLTTGQIDINGNYWVSNASASGSHDIYKVDITTLTATVSATNLSNSNDQTSLRAAPQFSWGIVNGQSMIERIDMTTKTRTTFSLANLKSPTGDTLPTGTYGTAWTYGNDNLGFGLNQQNKVFEIKVTNPSSANPNFELVAVRTGATAYNNDATSNGIMPSDVDLGITKKWLGVKNGRAQWEITVSNLSACGSSGFTVSDTVPSAFTGVQIDSYKDLVGGQTRDGAQSAWIPASNISGNVINFSHGRLNAGDQASFVVSAVPPTTTTCVENKASVKGFEDDKNTANNTAADGACSVQVDKSVKDINGDGKIDRQDTMQPGPNGLSTITYEVKVLYPNDPQATAPVSYTLTDAPKFATFVEVVGGRVTANISGYTPKTFTGSGPWTLTSAPQSISKGQVHTYTVSVHYKAPSVDVSGETQAQCQANSAGFGLYNTATVKSNNVEQTDDACAPVTGNPPVDFYLTKHEQNTNNPLTGAEFALFGSDASGKMTTKLTDFKLVNGMYQVLGLTPGIYYLVETKAPDTSAIDTGTRNPGGFSLLATPVQLTISRNAAGTATVTFDKSGGSLATDQSSQHNATANQLYIALANVYVGTLPRTGGQGMLPYIVASALLLVVGVAAARRRIWLG